MSQIIEELPLRDDLLIGAKAAGEYVGVSARKIYGLVEIGFVPAVKVGPSKNSRLYFRKSILNTIFMPPKAND